MFLLFDGWVYNDLKMMSEYLVLSYYVSKKFNVIIICFGDVYGFGLKFWIVYLL